MHLIQQLPPDAAPLRSRFHRHAAQLARPLSVEAVGQHGGAADHPAVLQRRDVDRIRQIVPIEVGRLPL
jgi:hypothetical protein